MQRWLAVVMICAAAMARAQNLPPPPIPLCPIEGPDVFVKNPLSVGAQNCQPVNPTDDISAKCWTRSPDSLIPAWLVECHCYYNGSGLTPGMIPGNYAIASAGPCTPGIAVVITSIVGNRSWAVDAGCDDAGNLCSSTAGAFLAEDASPFRPTIVKKQRCHVFASGRQHCRTVE